MALIDEAAEAAAVGLAAAVLLVAPLLLHPGQECREHRPHGQHISFSGGLPFLEVVAKLFFGGLVGHFADLAEVGPAVGVRVPVGMLADLLLAEFGFSHGVTAFCWCGSSKR